MISILIPVYNTDVGQLVNELSRQLIHSNIECEILVFDDDSSPSYKAVNKPITATNKVLYRELDRNYGRSAIRQLLAESAQHEWLLFIDSDSGIVRNDFLARYLAALKKECDVYVGGTVYQSTPVECAKKLHWKYGRKRESAKANSTALHTNNFCIKRTVFQNLSFPGFLRNYGHEDTWMRIELERSGKKICHIDNPVEHLNIERTEFFLQKTHHALENLLLLQAEMGSSIVSRYVSLLRLFIYVKRIGAEAIVKFFYDVFKKKILRNLNSCNPSLPIFDFYRLYHLLQLSKKKKPVNDYFNR